MSDLDFLRGRIAGYAGYAGAEARHQVDKQVRAFLGEALSEVRERLSLPEPLAERLDRVLFRCEFSDQRAVRAADEARFDQPLIDRVHALDRELVQLADRIRTVPDAAGFGEALEAADRGLDERFGALAATPR